MLKNFKEKIMSVEIEKYILWKPDANALYIYRSTISEKSCALLTNVIFSKKKFMPKRIGTWNDHVQSE